METRTSALDSILNEISRLGGAGNMFASLRSSQEPAPEQGLEALGLRRRASTRTRLPAPKNLVTAKVIALPSKVATIRKAIEDMSGQVLSSGPEVIIANVPVDRLSDLGSLKGVTRAEAPRRFYHRMDEARGDISRVDIALDQHPTLRGEGVVVGIIDSGIDWKHQDFLNSDGKTRIETFIHGQTDDDPLVCQCNQYSEDQINAALSGSIVIPQGDPHGHGTHCASIAAGNGFARFDRKFAGVAPMATLMGARLDDLTDANIIESIRRIFAQAGGRPTVINLSLGGHFGPHDGTSAIENVISRETGPGKIVVVAAGNEAEDRIHYQGQLVEDEDLDIEFTIRDEVQAMTVWIPRGDTFSASLVEPDGTVTPLTGAEQHTANGAFLSDLSIDQINGDTNLALLVAANMIGRRWKLRLHAESVISGEVHAWAETWENPNAARDKIFMSESSPNYSLGMPGTEERAIVVGSLTSRTSILPDGISIPGLIKGRLSPFSSHGPTRTGVHRPDIVAPGQWIVAAMAHNSMASEADAFKNRRLDDGDYISFQGTSMATPFVTGVIALMLQQEPQLTPEDIRLRLRATAHRDADTGAVWNPGYGQGKLNVEALLNYGKVF